jgi:hypothetical protein
MSLKVTLFGGTGQGKTTYTLGLLYLMVEGIDGFRIEDEDVDTTTKYMKPWSDFVMVKQWPAPTMGRREDRFKLYFQDQFITDFLWVDYQGGAINQPTDESDAAAQLHADIQLPPAQQLQVQARAGRARRPEPGYLHRHSPHQSRCAPRRIQSQ